MGLSVNKWQWIMLHAKISEKRRVIISIGGLIFKQIKFEYVQSSIGSIKRKRSILRKICILHFSPIFTRSSTPVDYLLLFSPELPKFEYYLSNFQTRFSRNRSFTKRKVCFISLPYFFSHTIASYPIVSSITYQPTSYFLINQSETSFYSSFHSAPFPTSAYYLDYMLIILSNML